MPKSPAEMAAAMLANLEEKTGKRLEAWLKIAARSKLEKHGALTQHLKSEHGVTHGFANLIAHEFLNAGAAPSDGDLVETQYSGAKAGLLPIYATLTALVAKLGKDAELAPKKAYVSLRRSKQFGLIQPSTKTRVDLGLNLKGVAARGRLESSGSFSSMVTHRVRLERPGDVDAEVRQWLKQAYDMA